MAKASVGDFVLQATRNQLQGAMQEAAMLAGQLQAAVQEIQNLRAALGLKDDEPSPDMSEEAVKTRKQHEEQQKQVDEEREKVLQQNIKDAIEADRQRAAEKPPVEEEKFAPRSEDEDVESLRKRLSKEEFETSGHPAIVAEREKKAKSK